MTSGTLTTLVVGTGGTMDLTHDMGSHTISASTLYAGAALIDSFATLQASFPFTLAGCRIADLAVLDLGLGRSYTRV